MVCVDEGWYMMSGDWTLGLGEVAHLLYILAINVHRFNQPSPHTLREISGVAAGYTFCLGSIYSTVVINWFQRYHPVPLFWRSPVK